MVAIAVGLVVVVLAAVAGLAMLYACAVFWQQYGD